MKQHAGPYVIPSKLRQYKWINVGPQKLQKQVQYFSCKNNQTSHSNSFHLQFPFFYQIH